MVIKVKLRAEKIDIENLIQYITPKDIRTFGLIPEIIGRLPVLSHMNPLDKSTLRSILTDPKNALIKQYQKLFSMDNISLTFTTGALDFIVQKALDYNLGARGLRSLCEGILNQAMFELPGTEISELKVNKIYAEEQFKSVELPALKAVS